MKANINHNLVEIGRRSTALKLDLGDLSLRLEGVAMGLPTQGAREEFKDRVLKVVGIAMGVLEVEHIRLSAMIEGEGPGIEDFLKLDPKKRGTFSALPPVQGATEERAVSYYENPLDPDGDLVATWGDFSTLYANLPHTNISYETGLCGATLETYSELEAALAEQRNPLGICRRLLEAERNRRGAEWKPRLYCFEMSQETVNLIAETAVSGVLVMDKGVMRLDSIEVVIAKDAGSEIWLRGPRADGETE